MDTKEHSAQDFWQDQEEEAQFQEDIDREWKYRREEFRKSGLREGYEAGKQETVQQGFDQGALLRICVLRTPSSFTVVLFCVTISSNLSMSSFL